MKSKRANFYLLNTQEWPLSKMTLDYIIELAEQDMQAKAIEAFKQWFKGLTDNEPMEHSVNKFVELMNK